MSNKIPIKEQLKHMGNRLKNELCLMFGESKETTNHLFFGCKIATKV